MGVVYKEEKVKENFKKESLLDIYQEIAFNFLHPAIDWGGKHPIT